MLKRIRSMIAKDVTHSRRENLLVYMIFAPIVLALITRLILPSLETMDWTIAVDSSVPEQMVSQLKDYATVEVESDFDSLKNRIMDFDDVAGVYYEDGTYYVLLEGNEGSAVQDMPGAIIDYLNQDEKAVDINTTSLGRASTVREFTSLFFVQMCILIGGLAIALGVVNEKETRTMRALATSPLNTLEYIFSKSAFGLLISLILSLVISALIMGGTAINYLHLTIAVLGSLGIAIMLGFVIGLVANDQITAIAALKVGIMFFLMLPIASLFIPQKWMWVMYPFPNYWSFESLRRVFLATELPYLAATGITAAFSIVSILIMVPLIKRKFKLG